MRKFYLFSRIKWLQFLERSLTVEVALGKPLRPVKIEADGIESTDWTADWPPPVVVTLYNTQHQQRKLVRKLVKLYE